MLIILHLWVIYHKLVWVMLGIHLRLIFIGQEVIIIILGLSA
jgi:hypothetical protein